MRSVDKKITIFTICLMLFGLLAFPALSGAWSRMVPANFSELAQQAKSGVVNIQTVKTIKGGGRVFRHFFGSPFGNQPGIEDFFSPFRQMPRNRTESSLGSGFIIDKTGYIVTNNHVIKDADQIKVILHNDKEYDARIIGADSVTDLALIKIDAKDLKPLKFGSSKNAQVGSWVVAIGSPFGLEQTVTAGIVSAKGRIIGSGPYDDFIQTDASINPGNSGGPLLNMDGEVVGINTAIIKSGQGIGFAIPSDLATSVIDQLKDSKRVSRGWLGVSIQDVSKEMSEYYTLDPDEGVYVAKAYEDNPAYEAGIRQGDVIVSVEGVKISSSRDLTLTIANLRVGSKVDIGVIRQGKNKTFTVKLGERPDNSEDSQFGEELNSFDDLGFMFKSLNEDLAGQLGYPSSIKGLVVTQIDPGSQAAMSGVRTGDLLVEINHKKITRLSDYTRTMGKIEKGQTAHMLFRRGNSQIFVVRFEK
ncbi:peptidase [Desulfobacter hydrogenophilus]|uniref:Probable periplasmic serine endoprotease DegP-like n=1 Tax=Desulfobacter hydrogenophilus TaxID=2291 RepID=A0A328FHK7_9BACT|nr:Do family serine endopeptidase [Desulfobacter hydrogenophilus]NDY71622.1 Do family serine endopeptidase [Desulfobacter hydrogenophilus]QBH15399.1 Do family serine endopeptidase [Desulfobacter hydrogenophilus]RAM02475.1 peptidase [Desulfobacter hydrogenophilus]